MTRALAIVAGLCGGLLSGDAMAQASPRPRPPPAPAPPSVPKELQGGWYASSSAAMGITGDIRFTTTGMRTALGEIPLRFQPVAWASQPSWIAPLTATDHRILPRHNNFCAAWGDPDDARWMIATLDAEGGLMLRTYSSPRAPLSLEPEHGACHGLAYGDDDD